MKKTLCSRLSGLKFVLTALLVTFFAVSCNQEEQLVTPVEKSGNITDVIANFDESFEYEEYDSIPESSNARGMGYQHAWCKPTFRTLVAAIDYTGIGKFINDQPTTIFGPTDWAFARIGLNPNNIREVPKDELRNILTYHVLLGRIYKRDVEPGPITMLNTDDIEAKKCWHWLFLKGAENKYYAQVIYPDIEALNGVFHIINRVLLPPEKETKNFWTRVEGLNVHYTKNSHAVGRENIVFVHGLGGNVGMYASQSAYFLDKANTIVIELPGFGMSDKPVREYTMRFHAKAVYSVMKDSETSRANLVAHSMGLAVCRELVKHKPGMVEKLVNLDGGVFHYPTVQPQRDNYINETITYWREGFANPTPEFLAEFIDWSAPPILTGEDRANFIANGVAIFMSQPAYVLGSCMYDITREELWYFTPEWKTPVLTILGHNPTAEELEIEQGIHPGSTVVPIPWAGHLVHIFAADQVNGLIEAFIL